MQNRTQHQAAENADDRSTVRLFVSGMDCASCAATIERSISTMPGIESVKVNFASETMDASGTASLAAIEARLRQIGYGIDRNRDVSRTVNKSVSGFWHFVAHDKNALRAFGGAAFVLLTQFGRLVPGWPIGLENLALIAVVVFAGLPIARKGLAALLHARRITIDLLMTIAIIGAIGIGAYGEAAAVVLLFLIGEALEAYSAARSRNSISELMQLQPEVANLVVEHDGHSHLKTVEVDSLSPGDRVSVNAGDRVPADGVVTEGISSIDESAVTGEPLPVTRGPGDSVHAGTINGDGTIEVTVDRKPSEFLIARIATLVAQAQDAKSPAERQVDRFAQWYTPLVVALAALVVLVPPLLFGASFTASADGSEGWLYRGLALLIIACPCALILSIPVTVVSALTRLTHSGVLVKGGAMLSKLSDTRVFAFDKTGTLTHGRPVIARTRTNDCAHAEAELMPCQPCDDVVAIAAALEQGSSHPLASAIVHAANERAVTQRYDRASSVRQIAGKGITGIVNGARISVGNRAFTGEQTNVENLLQNKSSQKDSLVIVSKDDRAIGYFELTDELRPETKAALQQLKEIDGSYRFALLSGDGKAVAETIAAEVGTIDEVHAELLPEQKLEIVRDLERKYGAVAMIGDGINDSPALAGATLGIAMGAAGSPQAMESSDVVLMNDNLSALATAVLIARKTRVRIRENIALSLGLKVIFLALAIPGLATLWMAVLADVGTTLLVVLNGMRILREPDVRLT